MALVMVLISHSGLSSSTSAHVLGSDGRHNTKRLKKKKKGTKRKSFIHLNRSVLFSVFTHRQAQELLHFGADADDSVQALLINTWAEERGDTWR